MSSNQCPNGETQTNQANNQTTQADGKTLYETLRATKREEAKKRKELKTQEKNKAKEDKPKVNKSKKAKEDKPKVNKSLKAIKEREEEKKQKLINKYLFKKDDKLINYFLNSAHNEDFNNDYNIWFDEQTIIKLQNIKYSVHSDFKYHFLKSDYNGEETNILTNIFHLITFYENIKFTEKYIIVLLLQYLGIIKKDGTNQHKKQYFNFKDINYIYSTGKLRDKEIIKKLYKFFYYLTKKHNTNYYNIYDIIKKYSSELMEYINNIDNEIKEEYILLFDDGKPTEKYYKLFRHINKKYFTEGIDKKPLIKYIIDEKTAYMAFFDININPEFKLVKSNNTDNMRNEILLYDNTYLNMVKNELYDNIIELLNLNVEGIDILNINLLSRFKYFKSLFKSSFLYEYYYIIKDYDIFKLMNICRPITNLNFDSDDLDDVKLYEKEESEEKINFEEHKKNSEYCIICFEEINIYDFSTLSTNRHCKDANICASCFLTLSEKKLNCPKCRVDMVITSQTKKYLNCIINNQTYIYKPEYIKLKVDIYNIYKYMFDYQKMINKYLLDLKEYDEKFLLDNLTNFYNNRINNICLYNDNLKDEYKYLIKYIIINKNYINKIDIVLVSLNNNLLFTEYLKFYLNDEEDQIFNNETNLYKINSNINFGGFTNETASEDISDIMELFLEYIEDINGEESDDESDDESEEEENINNNVINNNVINNINPEDFETELRALIHLFIIELQEREEEDLFIYGISGNASFSQIMHTQQGNINYNMLSEASYYNLRLISNYNGAQQDIISRNYFNHTITQYINYSFILDERINSDQDIFNELTDSIDFNIIHLNIDTANFIQYIPNINNMPLEQQNQEIYNILLNLINDRSEYITGLIDNEINNI
jgi:hypothetical protein